MTEPKFTPGPWKFDGEESAYYDLPTLNILDKDGDIVAGAVDYIDESSLPNAHLIAAAPDLYNALENVMHEIQFLGDEEHYFGTTERFDAARAALAKARGET